MYSLESLFKEFVFYSKLRGNTVKTVKKYSVHLNVFNRYLSNEGVDSISKLNHLVIRRFLFHTLEKGQVESTVNTYLRTIRAFFVFCIKEEIVEYRDNPCLKVDWLYSMV